jgi:hypothetical protein
MGADEGGNSSQILIFAWSGLHNGCGGRLGSRSQKVRHQASSFTSRSSASPTKASSTAPSHGRPGTSRLSSHRHGRATTIAPQASASYPVLTTRVNERRPDHRAPRLDFLLSNVRLVICGGSRMLLTAAL